MAQFKKYGVPALIIVVGILVSFLVCILLHGWVMTVVEDPFTVEGLTEAFEDQKDSQVLDHRTDGDSALTLVEKSDGNVFLLVFHKNLLLPRYQLMDVVHVVPEEDSFQANVKTVTRSYPVVIEDHQQILAQEAGFSLQMGNFFLLYGLNTLLLFLLGFMVWRTGRKIRRARKQQEKKTA